jgi:hypothetical protein
MREAQIKMLEDLIDNSDKEYNAEGVEVRIALSHVPLRCYGNFPEMFAKWTELLNKMGIHVMLAGHTHRVLFLPPEHAPAEAKHNFPSVECGSINRDDLSLCRATALTIGKDKITVRFTDIEYTVHEEYYIDLK